MADVTFSLPAGLPADPALFSTLLDLLPLGVIYYTPVVDAAGTLTDLTLAYLNPAAQRMARLPAQPGTTYRQQFPTTDDNGAWNFHHRSWLSQEAGQFQFYYQADGFDAYFRVTAQRLGDGLLVLFTDTQDEDRSHAEEALRATQAREQAARAAAEARQAVLYAVFEQAPVAISLLQGPAHVIEFANARMAQLWDRPLAQVAGQAHFAALPELAGQGFEEILGTVWRTGEPYYLQEQFVSLRRAGQPYQGYFNITYQPSYDGQGQRTGVLTSAIDVTEQVLVRQQVEQLNAELEARVLARTQELRAQQALLATTNEELLSTNQALHTSNQRLLRTNADLDTFVYTASHDLKSPLTNLEGLLAALRDTLPIYLQQQPLVSPLLNLLDNTVSRFRLTIEQLTELIRLQQTPVGPAQLVLLGPLVRAIQEDLLSETTVAQAQVHVAIDEGLAISFAPANLRSIVYNLLSNGLKYRDPGRPAQVWVRAERQAAAIVIMVQDNGLGLSESQQQRLFQAFQRLHTHVEGTGVGLYMIKRLIENAGATIAVTSVPGVGSTFTVTFPA